MKHYYLKLNHLSKVLCVPGAVVKSCEDKLQIPLLSLHPESYQNLGFTPPIIAPTIGIMMEQSKVGYSVNTDYVTAIAKTGVNICFLTYPHYKLQLQACSGIVLPDGTFTFPDNYYTDSRNEKKEYPSIRSKAYADCLNGALARQIPILGIGTGALMIAGEFGLKLYRSSEYAETPIEHYSCKDNAHRLDVLPDNLLSHILHNHNQIFVNSHHTELLAPIKVQQELWAISHGITTDKVRLPLDIYATANDGLPEAWGSKKLHILCLQFCPEKLAVKEDTLMQRIFKWLADEATARRQIFS